MNAIINGPICPIMTRPRPDCALADEALYGMEVEVLEETDRDYWKVRTAYHYEGYAPAELLLTGPRQVESWRAKAKKAILHKNFADVMAEPRVQSWPLITLPMGASVSPAGEADDGWTPVELVDGQPGYVRTSWLGEHHEGPADLPEALLRARLVETAMRYQGAPYRWGGKTPQGIDCSGLVSMAYLLNGITVCRDARLEPGFDLVEIGQDEMKPGDVLFFPGHAALYLGEGRYLHSTGKAGSDGVAENSLDPAAPDYRADLAGSLLAVGSYAGFHP